MVLKVYIWYKFWNDQHFDHFKTHGPGSDKYKERKSKPESWCLPLSRVWKRRGDQQKGLRRNAVSPEQSQWSVCLRR